ncbi:N-acyl-L-amino acid amidohydrolase [Anoxybacillus sp. BCO1]|nr:N-acyl-L-amino acid amidohydrolase [Anoxybacillus sp. BCO1]
MKTALIHVPYVLLLNTYMGILHCFRTFVNDGIMEKTERTVHMKTLLFTKLHEYYDDMVAIRRHFHQHPELSFQEYKTAAYIANYYKQLGIPVRTNVGGNGVVATIHGQQGGKTVALRADFDALPIQDEKDVPYKSTVPGVMHACGHDGHTATLLVLAKALYELREHWSGTIVCIHQHAEEYAPGGAKAMIEDGCLEGVDAIFGTHLWATEQQESFNIVQDRSCSCRPFSNRYSRFWRSRRGTSQNERCDRYRITACPTFTANRQPTRRST